MVVLACECALPVHPVKVVAVPTLQVSLPSPPSKRVVGRPALEQRRDDLAQDAVIAVARRRWWCRRRAVTKDRVVAALAIDESAPHRPG